VSLVPSRDSKLRGVITPLVTPLRNRHSLDEDSLERLVEHVISGGVHGLFVLGSTGEAPSLSLDLRCCVIRRTSEIAGNRVPLVVNVADTAFEDSVRLANESAEVGAFAVALSPPCYFPLDQRQLRAYIANFCERSPLPVFLYNVPQFAHTALKPSTVCQLAELPNVIGLKNSDGSLEYLRTVQAGLAHRHDFSLLVGNEEIFLTALQIGADGGICGGANMFPKIFVRLFEAAANGNDAEADKLQQTVVQVSEAVYRVGPSETSYLRGLKRALAVLELIEDVLAEPLQNFDSAERAQLDSRFADVLKGINNVPDTRKAKTS
jgi:dihydrodipicolinate synthase/N-acetylneuraminate lyase